MYVLASYEKHILYPITCQFGEDGGYYFDPSVANIDQALGMGNVLLGNATLAALRAQTELV